MAAYPGSLAVFAGFTSTHTLAADNHAAQHNLEQAEIVAVQTKVGTGSATPSNNTVLRGTGAGTSAWAQVALTTDITGTLPIANGGTGQTSLTALPLASPVISGTVPGGATYTSPILSTPTIADFSNANHSHANTAGGGQLNGANALQPASTPLTRFSAGALRLGLNQNAGGTLAVTYSNYATVTATSNGNEVECEISAVVANGNSGANRTFDIRVLCDGVAITPSSITGLWATYVAGNSPPYIFSFNFSSTPAAGSHTWTLQLQASAAGSVLLTNNYIKVAEVV